MRTILLIAACMLAAVVAPGAHGSMIIDRDATAVRLDVDGKGRAVVHYRVGRKQRHVLAWGAINAQVRFRLDYAGGWGVFKRPVWKEVRGCGPYDGPELAWLVVACKAPDGSYWAIQRWQRMLPNQGYAPRNRIERAWEIHLSHWKGPIPELELFLDWVYGGRFHHLFGYYRYLGKPVHGYRSTGTGVPLDPYGRNIYLDVYGSVYGRRWVRENSFLAHRPGGTFCYGFFPRPSYYDKTQRPAGHGERYRATAIGPGVAPDPYWERMGLGSFDAVLEADMNRLQQELMGADRLCRQT